MPTPCTLFAQALLICLMERLSQWSPPEDKPEEDSVFALLSAQVSATIQKAPPHAHVALTSLSGPTAHAALGALP